MILTIFLIALDGFLGHRNFMFLWEKVLRDECGYAGNLPRWDWTLDSDDMTKAPIWSADPQVRKTLLKHVSVTRIIFEAHFPMYTHSLTRVDRLRDQRPKFHKLSIRLRSVPWRCLEF